MENKSNEVKAEFWKVKYIKDTSVNYTTADEGQKVKLVIISFSITYNLRIKNREVETR